MITIVFAFEGTRAFGHPGWIETAERVQQDFGVWRKATNTDGESIRKWLGANGYRVLNLVGRAHDNSPYRAWWGLVSVFGEPVLNEHGTGIVHMPVDEIRAVVKQQQEQPAPKHTQQDAALEWLGKVHLCATEPIHNMANSMYDDTCKPVVMQQQLRAMRESTMLTIAREHPELSAKDVAEEYKARVWGQGQYA